MASVPVRIHLLSLVIIPSKLSVPSFLFEENSCVNWWTALSPKGNHGSHQQERDEQSTGNEFDSEEAVYDGLQLQARADPERLWFTSVQCVRTGLWFFHITFIVFFFFCSNFKINTMAHSVCAACSSRRWRNCWVGGWGWCCLEVPRFLKQLKDSWTCASVVQSVRATASPRPVEQAPYLKVRRGLKCWTNTEHRTRNH